MKSHSLLINTRPSLIACKQNERKPTSDCMSIKLTDFWSKILALALVAFSSFSFGRRDVKQDVSISIPKTITAVPCVSLESFRGIPSKSVSWM